MIKSPIFSVIVPTKNRIDLLTECINSILCQTFQDFELIIVDDQSSDGTDIYLNRISSQRIRVYKNNIGGDSGGRNIGIDAAQGEYVCICDDDDLYLPNYLLDFYNELKSRGFPSDVVLRTNFAYFKSGKVFKHGENYDILKHGNHIKYTMFGFCHSCVICIPRILLKDIEFPIHIKQWQDTYFLLRLLVNCRLEQMDTANYLYRIHGRMGSNTMITQGSIEDNADIHVSYIEDFYLNFNTLHPLYNRKNFNKIIATKYLEYASNTMGLKNYNLGFKFLMKSLSYSVDFINWKLYLIFVRNLVFDKSSSYKVS